MPRIPLLKPRKKSRRYPIKRDQYGRSARQRAFRAFDEGKRPDEVTQMVEISLSTARRYFADWKKLPQNIGIRYRIGKAALKKHEGFSATMIRTLADDLGMSEGEVIERLEKPWGLKQLMMGEWPNYRMEKVKNEREARLQAALMLIVLIEQTEMTAEEIAEVTSRLIKEYRRDGIDPRGQERA